MVKQVETETKNKRAPDIERMELQENMHSLNKDSNSHPSLGGWCSSYHFNFSYRSWMFLGYITMNINFPEYECVWVWVFGPKSILGWTFPYKYKYNGWAFPGFSWTTSYIYICIYITSSLNDECSYSRVQRFRQKFKQTYPSLKLLASPVVCPMFLFVYCKIRIWSDQVYTWPFWKKKHVAQLTLNSLRIFSFFQASKKLSQKTQGPAGKKDKLLLV